MDGTLLDLYFDDYFWEELLPEKYAEKYNLTIGEAQQELFSKYKAEEGTLNWTNVDYWSKMFGMDLYNLKKRYSHLIWPHSNAIEFLQALRTADKTVYLLTNAHYKSLEIKMEKTKLDSYLDGILTSFDVKFAKQQISFWKKAEEILKFDRRRSLFIDDSIAVLNTAREYGIQYVLLKTNPNSQRKKKASITNQFLEISDFKDLIP